MSPHTVISKNPEAIATEIDGEVVLMSLITGRTFGLDKRGSRIWGLLEQPRALSSVVVELLKIYDAAPEKFEADLKVFFEKLAEAQLVTFDDTKQAG